jgi:hypothetical protein
MGNQPSRDGGTLEKPGMQRSNSMKIANKRNNKNNPKTRSPPTSFTVSPVRHQLVLTNHVSPLVPLTDHLPRRRRSSSTRIMITRSTSPFQEDTSTDSMTSRDFLPIAGSPLSSSYNSRQSDEFSSMFESTGSHSSARNSKYKSDHLDHWIYDYGTEKERDR